jgi:hypothetical protein
VRPTAPPPEDSTPFSGHDPGGRGTHGAANVQEATGPETTSVTDPAGATMSAAPGP